MPKILIDNHHQALRYSLQLLFEKRLGWEVYTQIGMGWWDEKLWAIYPARDTASQFLDEGQAAAISDGIYSKIDDAVGKSYKAITLDKFKNTKFDVLLCSIPEHIGIWIELQRRWQPQARLVFQAGNAFSPDPRISNFLGSIAPVSVPSGMNAVFYHQEFDLDTYHYKPPTNHNTCFSFIHYLKHKELMDRVAALLPEWTFRSFGAGLEDHAQGNSNVADKMREAAFVWHNKPGSDGFGHVAFGTYAVGRPAIIWGSQHRGKACSALYQHNHTCLDVEQLGGIGGLVERLKTISTDEHLKMCEAAAARFREVVDYDREFEEIKKWLERLV